MALAWKLLQLFFVLLILNASLSSAAVISVCCGNSISDALTNAGKGDTVDVAAGSYEDVAATLSDGVTINFNNVTVTCPSCGSGAWLLVFGNATMEGTLYLSKTSLLVQGAVFTQYGDIDVTTSASSAYGVGIASGATWNQFGNVRVTLNVPPVTTVVGIQLNTGTWQQTGTATIVQGVANGTGVLLNDELAVWAQQANATIQASSGYAARLVFGTWAQSAPLIISNTDADGVSFVNSGASWQQNGIASITISSTSKSHAGVDMTTGGTWAQNGPVSFKLTAIDKGVLCSGTASGWTSAGTLTGDTGSCAPNGQAPSPVASPSTTPLVSPSPSRTSSPSSTPTISASPSPTISFSPSRTPSPSPSQTPSASPSPSQTPSASLVASPSSFPSSTPTVSPSPSVSRSPSATPSVSASSSPTRSPSSTPSASTTPSPSPSSSPVYLISNTTTVESVPVLQFNLTAPDIVLLPKDSQGTVQSKAAVGVSLGQIKEVNDDNSTVRVGAAVSGSWKQVADLELGASSSYLFSSSLTMTDTEGNVLELPAGTNDSRVELQFYLFDSATNISLGDLAFDVLPSYAKFSIRLFSWPWAALGDRIEMRMKINPAFDTAQRQANTPKAGITTFVLSGPHTAEQNTKTELRLVDSITLDGQQLSHGVTFDLDAKTSELVLRFDYFNSSLAYDPDLGVLFGSLPVEGESGGGGDNMGLIIAVAVVVPVAILIVVVVAVVGVLIARRTVRQRRRTLTRSMQMHQL